MQAYVVGGAVRDELLGLPVVDRDWVVVGATPEEMTALGYRPVGKDFPVFLHPETHEEYALARTERRGGKGGPPPVGAAARAGAPGARLSPRRAARRSHLRRLATHIHLPLAVRQRRPQ